MAWPSFHPPAKPPASDLLMEIINYSWARADTVPDWTLVAAAATECIADQCHGHHCDPGMTDAWRYWWVYQAWTLIKNPNTQGTVGDAATCLGEINHGGGGSSGGGSGGSSPFSQISPAARAALKRVRKLCHTARRRK